MGGGQSRRPTAVFSHLCQLVRNLPPPLPLLPRRRLLFVCLSGVIPVRMRRHGGVPTSTFPQGDKHAGTGGKGNANVKRCSARTRI